jgi:hypothetical protein
MPEQAPAMDPAQLQAVRQSVTPEDFGQATLESMQEQDPELLAEIQSELLDLDLSPEDMQALVQIVDTMLNSPEAYPELRQQLIAMDMDDDVLPEQFDPMAISALRAVLSMIPQQQAPMEPMGAMEPQGFAKGGPVSMKPIAEFLAKQGRGGDTMLAHINPSEAALLKRFGGSGTINPMTGLPEFKLKKALKKLGKAVKKVVASPIGRVLVATGVTILSAGTLTPVLGATMGAAASGAVGGAVSSLAAGDSGKDIMKNALIGGVIAGGAELISPGLVSGRAGASTPDVGPTLRSANAPTLSGRISEGVQSLIGAGGSAAGGAGGAGAAGAAAASKLPGWVIPTVIGGTALGYLGGAFDPEKTSPDDLGMEGLPGRGETGFDFYERFPDRYNISLGDVRSIYAPEATEETPEGTFKAPTFDPFGSIGVNPTAPIAATPSAQPLPDYFSSSPQSVEEMLAMYQQQSPGGIATFAKGGYVGRGTPVQHFQTGGLSIPTNLTADQARVLRATYGTSDVNAILSRGLARPDILASTLRDAGTSGLSRQSQMVQQNERDRLARVSESDRIAEQRRQEQRAQEAYAASPQGIAAAQQALQKRNEEQEVARIRGLVSSGRMSLAEIPQGSAAFADARSNPQAYMTPQEREYQQRMTTERAQVEAEMAKIRAQREQEAAAAGLAARNEAARLQYEQGIGGLRSELEGMRPPPAPTPAPAPISGNLPSTGPQDIAVGGAGGAPAQIPITSVDQMFPQTPEAPPSMMPPPQAAPIQAPSVPQFSIPGTTTAPSPFDLGSDNPFATSSYYDPMAQFSNIQGTSTPVAFAQGGIAALAPSRFKGGGSRYYPRKVGPINGPGTGTSDSIPAMLSDGEFVFTAKAVRNAGGGSRMEGAKKMYKMMKALEQGRT